MKKIDKHTASYIELALKFYTLEHKERSREAVKQGQRPLFMAEFFDSRLAESLRELDRVTRKK